MTEAETAERAALPTVRRDTALTRAPKAATSPSGMLAQAIATGAPLEVVERLMALIERTDAREAKMAFSAALSAAKGEIPVIVKNKHVGFESRKAGAAKTDYAHEDFAEIARTVDPILARHGLSYRHRTGQANGQITVTCVLEHREGHAEETAITAAADQSGNKNSIQAIGSTITYLQRYTLKAALGLAASADDDGAKADQTIDGAALITEEQVLNLEDLLEETKAGRPDRTKAFLAMMKVAYLDDIPARQYDRAVAQINATRVPS